MMSNFLLKSLISFVQPARTQFCWFYCQSAILIFCFTQLTSFSTRVYYAARDGMAMSLYTLLADRAREIINTLLNEPISVEDGQRCTPLIIAARHGGEKVVKMLLDKFDTDIEQEGVVKFDGFIIEGASALWCAASAGHLNIVKTLVRKGADVNHTTISNSTPLRAACFEGRLDIVKYLVEHGADINIANRFNNTCLMIASYKGHSEVASFLLECGADPNERARCGTTALHFAAEAGHTQVVQELYNHGAKFVENVNGLTPLMTAAERACEDVMRYLLSLKIFSTQEVIDAYELLGASFANDKDHYCLTRAYRYLEIAMLMRHKDPDNIIRKKLGAPIAAYEFWVECQTVEELEAIHHNHNSLHMESLAIRERLLGTENPEVTHPIIFRGAVFADNDRFDRCIELWLHALELRQNNSISVVKDLLRFAQVFSQILNLELNLEFKYVMSVLKACKRELRKNKTQIENHDVKDDIENILAETDCNITSTLYILTILTKVIRKTSTSARNNNDVIETEEDFKRATERISLRKLVYSINKLNMSLRNGQTLLHLAVNSETPVDDFHTNDICKFPCTETTKLLVQCGADVNALDCERNTPLHIIVSYQKPISDFFTLHSIILLLEESGAHYDIVNKNGQTPLEACSTGVSEIILRTQRKINLQCLAARVIKFNNINYKDHVPIFLESFIELHGTGL